jgi:hypothetical protein
MKQTTKVTEPDIKLNFNEWIAYIYSQLKATK